MYELTPAFLGRRFHFAALADRLLHGHGLSRNDGERVEGYSNVLWVLACAALGAAGIDLVVAARVLGGTFSVLALLGVVEVGREARQPIGTTVLAVGFLALSAPMAV